MKIKDLFESRSSLHDTIASMNIDSLPIRLKIFVDTNYDNHSQFLQAIRQFEMINPVKAKQIVDSGKYGVLSSVLQDVNTGIDTIRSSQLNIRKVEIDEHLSTIKNTIVLEDGRTPIYLFRYVDHRELNQIESDGFIQPSQFYGRIHASAYPEPQYQTRDGSLLAIKFDSRDGWVAKLASVGVYAVTDKRIPLSKIKKVI